MTWAFLSRDSNMWVEGSSKDKCTLHMDLSTLVWRCLLKTGIAFFCLESCVRQFFTTSTLVYWSETTLKNLKNN